jgi:hypothetical protein
MFDYRIWFSSYYYSHFVMGIWIVNSDVYKCKEKEERKKENTFIGLHIQVKQIKEDTNNRNKYITDLTLETTIHRKCSPNGPCLRLCFCGTRKMSQERCYYDRAKVTCKTEELRSDAINEFIGLFGQMVGIFAVLYTDIHMHNTHAWTPKG